MFVLLSKEVVVGEDAVAHSVPIVWYLLATIVFVLLNGFFVAAEFALVKVRVGRMSRLHQRAIGGLKPSPLVATLGRFPDKGDEVNIGDYRATVASLKGHRVELVRFEKNPGEPTDLADGQ